MTVTVRAGSVCLAVLTSFTCLVCLAVARGGGPDTGPASADPGVLRTAGFIRGADISFLQEIEDLGGVFRENGKAGDVLDILGEHGFDYARLRVWHTPSEGYCGLDSTLVMASRIKAKGWGLLLDLHYSDWWADPGRQYKPWAWIGLAFDALRDSVYEYTRSVVTILKRGNGLPDIVQIGNEITCGLLWDEGRVCGRFDTPGQWANLAELVSAGIRGVGAALDAGDSTLIMIHIDRGGDVGGATWFFDRLAAQGVDFDVIGLSYYPWWHGTLDDVDATVDSLARRYGKDIIIVETAYPWTLDWHDDTHNLVGLPEQLLPGYPATVDGQRAFLADLIDIVAAAPGGRGRGLFYWAPECISVQGMGSPWENLALFDFNGDLLPSVSAFEPASERASEPYEPDP